MRTDFRLDGCNTLVIDTGGPRAMNDPNSVLVQIDYEPIATAPVEDGESPACPMCGRRTLDAKGWDGDHLTGSRQRYGCRSCQFDGVIGRRPLFATALRPSHARAIASALLSAATEAR